MAGKGLYEQFRQETDDRFYPSLFPGLFSGIREKRRMNMIRIPQKNVQNSMRGMGFWATSAMRKQKIFVEF
jgi:hypothetical protein